ncbi:sodium / potassium ATPase beta chain [Dictyocaulus viviparus]|uniref:Sodium / potassium ATPase beta chain n=1 Tax=Dictyocaulus viviparus TaxID=29172 RepID=A0A0D8XHD1_DICVI|nr:sodium / potassium ATPase beta chain [Dictyocaulus viviparus]
MTKDVDQVSAEGPKKSDGSEFRKGFLGWVMSFVYLFIVWMFGLAFSISVMLILLSGLKEKPHYFGRGTHIGGTPRIVFEPNPNRFDILTRSVIRFRPRDPKSYENHMIRYKMLLRDEYNNTSTSKCTSVMGAFSGFPTNESVCHMEAGDPNIYGVCALTLRNINRGMGFSRRRPCIMLRLTRIFGWYPNDSDNLPNQQCGMGVTDCCNKRRIRFTCNSKKPINMDIYPKDGMSTCAFPFWNQVGYEQPFVMLRISNLTTGMHEIFCKPNLKSIAKLDNHKENIVRIAIDLID